MCPNVFNPGYDVAQICLNGHMVNSSSRDMPEHNEKFCSKCGAGTITTCQNCNHAIRGYYWGSISVETVRPPAFCHNCGQPYPWTKNSLAAVDALVQEADRLDSSEKEALVTGLNELVRDTPQTEPALLKVKRLLQKAGNTIAPSIKQVMISVVTEAVKQRLWPS